MGVKDLILGHRALKLQYFCPNRRCRNFQSPPTGHGWYKPHGFYPTESFGRVQRYRCRCCGKTFSTQTFSPDYYRKKAGYRRRKVRPAPVLLLPGSKPARAGAGPGL